MIPLAVTYLPDYSYELGPAHCLFVYNWIENRRPRIKKRINPLLLPLLDPVETAGQTPWTNSYIDSEKSPTDFESSQ